MEKEILVEKTQNRKEFIRKAFEWEKFFEEIKDKNKILIKPNIVSQEEYPTTTHPETLEECLKLLLKVKPKDRILVADGPAFDAGNSSKIIKNHSLKKVCEKFGIPLINLNKTTFRKISAFGLNLLIPEIVLEADYIISLPVLKTHRICKITGALKNQYGFLPPKQKLLFHFPFRDIHKTIAVINKIIKINFFVVDAIYTLIKAQEKRHGGEVRELGYMLAGRNPILLDLKGLELLQKIDPSLKGLTSKDILQINWFLKLKETSQ
ncbi:MAG: DUF362 domain-containing protein [Candidatus Pacebacteria bacterium]|nr:DUF362 domain-containing protein [Candidatus Paceibacterota bacterium]